MRPHESTQGLFSESEYVIKPPSGPCGIIDNKRSRLKLQSQSEELYCPFIWHEPAWHRMDKSVRDQVVQQCANQTFPVAALNCEAQGAQALPGRIVPYRPDRFGLTYEDLNAAGVIDLRLVSVFSNTLPARYSSSQLRHWAVLPEKINPVGIMDAPRWPGDLRKVALLERKVQQLRLLCSGKASIWVTIDLLAFEELRDALITARVDGIVVQARGRTGKQIEKLLPAIRHSLKQSLPQCHMAVVADVQNPIDLVYLWFLGADWIALDAILEPMCETVPATQVVPSESSVFFYGQPPPPPPPPTVTIELTVSDLFDQTFSLLQYLGASTPSDLYLSKAFIKS